jgi:S-adenosylmethionine-dependent methyltransferase
MEVERMASEPDGQTWDELADRFVDGHYGKLYGDVRTHVIHEHLRAHLTPPPGRIVDIGGGGGHQSFPLAAAGYVVEIVDPSPRMHEIAADRRAHLEREVDDRIRLVRAAGEEAPAVLGGRQFDAVLCHGVLMYLDDPDPMLDALCALAKPGGIVSIVAKNIEVLAARPAWRGDWAGALAQFGQDRQINGLGVDTRADRVEDLSQRLRDRGVDPVAWYGVRLFVEAWTRERPATDDPDLVMQVELEASRRDPYRGMSRLFHLIGRRRP